MMTANLIENLTDEMEVIDTTISDTTEGAQKNGERIVRKYRAQGHACECIGVVARTTVLEYREETGNKVKTNAWGEGPGVWQRETRAAYYERISYSPVIFPKPSTEEE